ncbi:hypothetical protein FT663_01762 [Candidozyma haemuli var. vulneris]|uniref:DNA replication regulator SLD2 n=1 Tax=Candidozyma haemuli TaxID=45357 RepID=A0A2V1AS24_9ASCO|nr:hypothetical protein CXQ85_002328 [[Candida] haemuloni]KAF3989518.1 hypothetical protein FT662_02787 [[Candida] haemuloni var. vulneris]KAF3993773.1 hypothetical protein FT663_01762 [[Candida] haemuloni var. vulneris]PVH20534.1 hypothetical protein CXQ85_002328 [[Candida] haemuloni]
MSVEKELLQHKLQIKQWEKAFAKTNGRVPAKSDVKANPEIYKAYKTYNYLKSKQKGKQQDGSNGQSKASKSGSKGKTSSLEPLDFIPLPVEADDDSNEPHETNPPLNAELGPTPQANGKVLSLFDILSPPESSPLATSKVVPKSMNSSPLKDTTVFKTPTKSVKRIDYADLTPARNSSAKKSLTSALQSVSTPSKKESAGPDEKHTSIETPFYLGKINSKFQFNPEAVSPLKGSPSSPYNVSVPTINDPVTPSKPTIEQPRFSTSPSPFKTERMSSFGNNKKLTDVFNEAISFQIDEQLKLEVESELMLEMERDINEEEENAEEQLPMRTSKKRLTQKRTTRRWKIKPRSEDERAESFDGKNVHEEIKKIEDREQQELIEYMKGPSEMADSTDSDDEEETEYVRPAPQASEPSKKRTKLKPISNNFQRLKINDPRSKKFKQRMKRR